MKKLHLFIPLIAFTLMGCHKSPPAPPQSTADAAPAAPDAQAPAAQAPQPVATTPDNTVQQAVVGDVDPFLTSQLQIFVQQKQRMPNSFSELAHTRLDSTPTPPAGKKWAIDNSTGQVKAVAK